MNKESNNVKLLYAITEQLLLLLQNEPKAKEDWNEHINRIQQLLSKRQTLIDQLPGSYTPEEIQLGKKIIAMNETIDRLLKEFHKKIEHELKQIQKGKLMHQKYAEAPGYTFDGTFIDEKS